MDQIAFLVDNRISWIRSDRAYEGILLRYPCYKLSQIYLVCFQKVTLNKSNEIVFDLRYRFMNQFNYLNSWKFVGTRITIPV